VCKPVKGHPSPTPTPTPTPPPRAMTGRPTIW
jgi:hypothetical protein